MSHSPDRIKELILKSLIVALVPLLVYLLTANYWVIKEFNDLFYDSLLRLRGRSRDTSIVIVKIDDYSLQRYGHWPWPRRKLAAGISQIRGENLLALDLLFAEPTNSFDDSVLVDALMRHKKVVLAVGFQRKPVYPILPLLARASGLAHVIVAPSMDGVIRRMYSFQECSEEQILWAYPIEVVRVENDLPIEAVDLDRQTVKIGDVATVPLLPDGTFYINYIGGSESFPSVSFVDLAEGRIDPKIFKNKLVFVGITAVGLRDQYITPFTEAQNPMSGVEILAQASATLLRNKVVKPLERWKLLLITLVSLLLLGFIAEFEGYTAAFYLFLMMEAAFFGTSIFAFMRWRVFFPIAAPVFTLMTAFAVSLIVRLQELSGMVSRMVGEVSKEPLLFLSQLARERHLLELNLKVALEAEDVRIGEQPVPQKIAKDGDRKWFIRQFDGFWIAVMPPPNTEKLTYLETEIIPMLLRVLSERERKGEFFFKGLEQSISNLMFLQQKIRAENEIFTMLLDAMDGGIAVTDSIGRIQFCNKNFCDIFGISKEQSLGKSIFEVFEGTLNIQTDIDLRKVLFKGLKHVTGELVNKESNEIYAVAASAIRSFAGRGGLAVILYDVTRLRELIEAREFALHGLTHQFATPLMLVREYAKLARKTPQQADSYLEFIVKSAEDLQQMIEKFVMLSRLDTKETRSSFTQVDLCEVIKSAVENIRPNYPNKKVIVDLSDEPINILGNKDMLKVAVENLLDNALKYGRSTAKISAFQNDGRVRIEVHDDGSGVPEEEREQIFDKFKRGTKMTKRKGFGLGLALVKRIVEVHYGKIWVEDSKEFGGAKFVIEFPGKLKIKLENKNLGGQYA